MQFSKWIDFGSQHDAVFARVSNWKFVKKQKDLKSEWSEEKDGAKWAGVLHAHGKFVGDVLHFVALRDTHQSSFKHYDLLLLLLNCCKFKYCTANHLR